MTEQKISMDKKYKTRDGRDVRILCVDAARKQPVIGLIANGEIATWSIDGSFQMVPRRYADEYDLVEVKPERTMYLNIYTDGCANHLTREQADRGATGGRVACVKVTYREGQFDE